MLCSRSLCSTARISEKEQTDVLVFETPRLSRAVLHLNPNLHPKYQAEYISICIDIDIGIDVYTVSCILIYIYIYLCLYLYQYPYLYYVYIYMYRCIMCIYDLI